MHTIAVGELWHPDRKRWLEAVRVGRVDLGVWCRAPHVIVLLYRIAGACEWSDAPYSWHLVPEDRRALPEPTTSSADRALLQIILVEAESGIVRVIRAVTFDPLATRLLGQAIRDQAAAEWDRAAYDAELREAYAVHTTRSLLAAALVRCRGGD